MGFLQAELEREGSRGSSVINHMQSGFEEWPDVEGLRVMGWSGRGAWYGSLSGCSAAWLVRGAADLSRVLNRGGFGTVPGAEFSWGWGGGRSVLGLDLSVVLNLCWVRTSPGC